MHNKFKDIITLSKVDEEILELIRRIVANIDKDTGDYLYRILACYKVDKSDKDILVRLTELYDSILNKPLLEKDGEEGEDLYLMIKIDNEYISLKSIHNIKTEENYNWSKNEMSYDIVLGYKKFCFNTIKKRDQEIERIKIKMEMFNNTKFV